MTEITQTKKIKIVVSVRGPIQLGWDMIYMLASCGHPMAVKKMRLLPKPRKTQKIMLTSSHEYVYIVAETNKKRCYVNTKNWLARDVPDYSERGVMMTDDFNREDPILIKCIELFPKDKYNVRNYYLDIVEVDLALGQTYQVTTNGNDLPEQIRLVGISGIRNAKL